jgi:arginine repressor
MKKSEVVNWEELTTTNMLQIEAIVRILEREGITTQAEILDEIKKIELEMEQQMKNSSRMN